MENERSLNSGSLGLGVTAALSVVALMGAVGWRIATMNTDIVTTRNAAAVAVVGNQGATSGSNASAGSAASSSAPADPFAPSAISNSVVSALALEYTTLKSNGSYSTTTAQQVARSIGETIKANVSFSSYSAGDIKTVPDTSYAAMLAYRSHLQVSLKPLMRNTASEIDLLTKYEQTKDPTALSQLKQALANYRLAASSTAQIVVPADAVSVQLGILNAMQEFSATLDQMITSADDALTEATLINTFLDAQQHMTSSFNDLYTYYKSKQS